MARTCGLCQPDRGWRSLRYQSHRPVDSLEERLHSSQLLIGVVQKGHYLRCHRLLCLVFVGEKSVFGTLYFLEHAAIHYNELTQSDAIILMDLNVLSVVKVYVAWR